MLTMGKLTGVFTNVNVFVLLLGEHKFLIILSVLYRLEEQIPNYHVHPRVATVTYLSDTGVPTLILSKCSPPPTDPEKKSLGGSINKAWLSHPSSGKHIAFDGRYLHGKQQSLLWIFFHLRSNTIGNNLDTIS